MNKKILYFFLFAFIFFIDINFVNADENCVSVRDKINSYEVYKQSLESLDCTDNSDVDNVNACNENSVKRNIVVTEIMKLNDEKRICPSEEKEVEQIIKENEDSCGQIFDDTFNNFVNGIMKVFYILGPILLVLFGTLDFTKATVSNDAQALKKATRDFSKRLVATILLFLVPAVVNILLSFNVSDKYLSGNAYTCNYNYITFNKKYNILYVPRNNSATTLNGRMKIGGVTSDAEAEKLSVELTNMLNTKIHYNKENQKGPFPEYWSKPYNNLEAFQCTWWANGRASQYLAEHGTKYKSYPTQSGNGGDYYNVNVKGGWFEYGQEPRPNSIISWTQGRYGHVAYVEGVTKDKIYISHAGSGRSWKGVTSIPIDGSWGGPSYHLNGYIYLDSPR